jgi:MFS family permease
MSADSTAASVRTADVRPLAAGIAATTAVALPTLLVGGLSVLIQRDLSFGEAELGTAIATAFVGAALVAVPAGRLVERFGPRAVVLAGLASGGASLVGIGGLARSSLTLAAFLVLSGIGVTLVQVGVNVILARRVAPRRQGIAFGAKQAAVPLASLLAGLALPVIGVTLGWQAAFLLAALTVPVIALAVPGASPALPAAGAARGNPGSSSGPLALLALGAMLASAGGNATPAFIVASASDRGMGLTDAGLVLSAGSLVGIIVRVGSGWLADRLGRGSLLLVAGLVGVGSVGFVVLAVADHPALVFLGSALAFGGGWGWGGLLALAVSRSQQGALGRAMGIVQVGPMVGAVVGPFLFGTLAERVSFTAAWLAMTVLAVAAALTILASRRALLRSRPVAIGTGAAR